MSGTKMQGSFGLPEEMKKELNRLERRKNEVDGKQQEEPSVEEPISEPIVSDVEEMVDKKIVDTEPLSKEDYAIKIKKVMQEVRDDLKIEITEADIWAYLYNNEIIKKDVVIFPGRMIATFKTLSLNNVNRIDSSMAKIYDEKRLEGGYKNKGTQSLLAEGLLELGKPGEARSTGTTTEERFDSVGKMGAMLVDILGQKWNEFTFLVEKTIKMEMKEKKS